MVFKLIEAAGERWRYVNGPHLAALVRAGARFEKGVLIERPDRTRSGPRIMAAMRNLAISALRLAGRTDITEATRWASRSMDRPFTILGLT